jgi:glycosyltransferase involved in cell wall biosynthesis
MDKVCEYLACGKPIVATREAMRGFDDALPGEHYLLAADEHDLAEKILDCVRRPEEAGRIGRNARALSERYDWSRQAGKLLGLFEEAGQAWNARHLMTPAFPSSSVPESGGPLRRLWEALPGRPSPGGYKSSWSTTAPRTLKQTVASFPGIENLRYVYDPVPGLSRARNLGWQEARGRSVAYLDDDAVASPKWLERILFRFETLQPRPAGVGGRILPIWEAEKPAWLGEELEPYLGIVDWPACPMILDEDRFYLAGANVGYERGALRASGGFPTDLGRKGPLLLSNEELWMQRFLIAGAGPLVRSEISCITTSGLNA